MKTEIKGFLYAQEHRDYLSGVTSVRHYVMPWQDADPTGSSFGACLGPVEFTVDVDVVDITSAMRAAEIRHLQKQRDDAARLFADTTARINRRLAELQAIELSPEAPCAAA